ncbi:hypothetical protein FBY03_102265 [Pseudomonas sp. SJZ079]|uniref:hypothetical protein n=1 Tax=Pseudomonas sp. SJZ079 TaxID=2572887 RepID=UPI00119A3D6D|nr:hypothetical protein [Pseudomonas sp. SJZ079]TWC41517.1 hypothetical protein FBY03_102265 [Pseudomonas sp. SJZ079]
MQPASAQEKYSAQQPAQATAKALILAAETGAVDNAALRAISALDTLAASQTLGRLHHQRRMLVKGGAGPSTYYQLADLPGQPLFQTQGLAGNGLNANTSDLPAPLLAAIAALSAKPRKDKLWPLILWLCSIRPYSAEQLARQLNRQVVALKTGHLNLLREQQGLLEYLHREVVNLPQQAYVTSTAGRRWLAEQGIVL